MISAVLSGFAVVQVRRLYRYHADCQSRHQIKPPMEGKRDHELCSVGDTSSERCLLDRPSCHFPRFRLGLSGRWRPLSPVD